MIVTINESPVLDAIIDETESGPWLARVEVDAGAALSGQVTITAGTETFVGTVAHGKIDAGRWVAEIVGGANALQVVLPAKHYAGATAESILSDVMRECGETLDTAASDTSLLSHQFARWTRAAGEARLALQAVANELGAYWRVGRGGKVVMLKDDTWGPAAGSYVEEARDSANHEVRIAPDEAPTARPGLTVGGEKVVTVRTLVRSTGLRQLLQIHDGTDKAQDRPSIIADLARRANELAVIYSRWYPASVIQQEQDGSLQLMPDDERMAGLGITKVPLLTGIPGLTVKVQPKTRVRLFFENGQPSKPACALWDQGDAVLEVQLQATTKVVAKAPQLELGAADQAFVRGEDLMQYLDAVLEAVSTGLKAAMPASSAAPDATFKTALVGTTALKALVLSKTIKGS